MTSRSGGLLELVARGKKDVFFTSNPTVSFFHSVYMRSAAFTKEIYTVKPRNIPEWGHWVDFDIDHRGDLARQFYLRVNLPTWLPSRVATVNPTGLVTDVSGVTYGYTNNVGFQMLGAIQVYVDQVLVHEFYGEYLDWRLRQSYGLASTLLVSSEIGGRSESALDIARSATLPMMRIPLPVLGDQRLGDPGLPMVALRGQRFRLRIYIRNLEDVIVASDGRLKPQPYGIPLLVQSTKDGVVDTSQISLKKDVMRTIDMSLESTQIYVPADVQVYLKAQTLRFPFQSVQFQQYTIEDNQFTAASPPFNIQFIYPMDVDFIGSVDRMLVGLRSEASTQAGQLTNLRPPVGGAGTLNRFITSLRLNIANINRIQPFDVETFRDVTAYWKQYRMGLDVADPSLPQEVYTLTFGGYDHGEPAGTLNFTRASLPVMYLTLAPIAYDPRTISSKTFVLLYAESWNVFAISGGKGRMLFDDS